jgi:hypothetical protein
MALRPCKECKKEISSEAKVCPNCGKKQETGGGIGCLGVIIVLVVLYFIVTANDSKSGSGNWSARRFLNQME